MIERCYMAHTPFDTKSYREELNRVVSPVVLSISKSSDQSHFKDKTQLRMLYDNVNRMLNSITSEEVVCRYLGKTTTRHSRLTAEYEKAHASLMQMAVMFKLMH